MRTLWLFNVFLIWQAEENTRDSSKNKRKALLLHTLRRFSQHELLKHANWAEWRTVHVNRQTLNNGSRSRARSRNTHPLWICNNNSGCFLTRLIKQSFYKEGLDFSVGRGVAAVIALCHLASLLSAGDLAGWYRDCHRASVVSWVLHNQWRRLHTRRDTNRRRERVCLHRQDFTKWNQSRHVFAALPSAQKWNVCVDKDRTGKMWDVRALIPLI